MLHTFCSGLQVTFCILPLVATLLIPSPELFAQDMPIVGENRNPYDSLDPALKAVVERVTVKTGKREFSAALEILDQAIEEYDENLDDHELDERVVLETLRLNIARRFMAERDYAASNTQYRVAARFFIEHLNHRAGPVGCMIALRGLNELVRLDCEDARADELNISAIEESISLGSAASIGLAGQLSASYADVPAEPDAPSGRERLLEIITEQIEVLEAGYSEAPSEELALALSSFYDARARFYSDDVVEFHRLSLTREAFIAKAVQEFDGSLKLCMHAAKAAVLRASRIQHRYPVDARRTLGETIELLKDAERTIGPRVLMHIEAVEQMEDRISGVNTGNR
ncbi:MAG: hypothetical protein AAF456_21880 [Planctomycetota bacterium]